MIEVNFYDFIVKILISFFCGFLLGIERERMHAQYGARDHIFFSMISTILIILYDKFLEGMGQIIILLVFVSMIIFLAIGSFYRLFKANVPGYTTTLSMILAQVTGILSYYSPILALAIAVISLIVLSTKKVFLKVQTLQDIEWTGTIEFIAIELLLFILIPNDIIVVNINIKSIIIVFLTILAIKYVSYFLLKSHTKNNLYYISFLGGFAHSEAASIELSEHGAHPASIWLLIQTMLLRTIIILLIAPILLSYAIFPIITASTVGLLGSFLILKKTETHLILEKVKNPLSIKGALIFSGTYLLALMVTLILTFYKLNFMWYSIIAFLIGILSGGASSLFVTTALIGSLVSTSEALIMLSIGLSAAIINKIFYSLKALGIKEGKKSYALQLMMYQSITIVILFAMTFITLIVFNTFLK